MPNIALDYMYLNDQQDDATQSPVIVMVDEGTGDKYARVVPARDWDLRARLIGW